MPQRQILPKHILVPDTNILWHEDKSVCVSPKFDEFWNNFGNQYAIDLVLPEIVISELLYQHTTSALRAYKKVNTEFNRMSEIAGKRYTHRVQERKVREDVERKIRGWIQSVNGRSQPTAVDMIEWDRLIHDAVWRLPPFVEDRKNEKGFRDALVLETVAQISEQYPDIDLVFLSSDKLLLGAVKSRLGDSCFYYETLEEFETYLKLLDEQLTDVFVRDIQYRARTKFFANGDKSSLYYRADLKKKIKEEFSTEFDLPMAGSAVGLFRVTQNNKWEPVTDEKAWIRAPEFLKLEGNNKFYWRSKITFIQLFKYQGIKTGTLLSGITNPGDVKLRKIEFPVMWFSKVATNGRFYRLDIVEIDEAEKSFAPITQDDRDRFGVDESSIDQSA